MDTTYKAPTDKQLDFVRKLLAERKGVEAAETIRQQLNATAKQTGNLPSRGQVSAAIDSLLSIDRPRQVEFANLPAGHYAYTADDGHVAFAKVWVSKKSGYRGVDTVAGGPGHWQQFPMRSAQARTVLTTLARDPQAAARLFGQKHGVCGNCLSPLTDPQSRAAGYGPVCAQNNDFWYPGRDEALKLLGEDGSSAPVVSEPVGVSGLTVAEIVAQSRACHPDWTAQTHRAYLLNEEGVDVSVTELIERFGLSDDADSWAAAPPMVAPVNPFRAASSATDPSQLSPEFIKLALGGA